MGRIAKLISNVRFVLRDSGSRYNDESLLRKISDGQKDIVKKAELLRFKETIAVLANTTAYTCATSVLLIKRISDKTGAEIPITSHYQLDEISSNWEVDTGNTIEAIVIDKQNKKNITVYPKPIANYGNIFVFGSRMPTDIIDIDITSTLEIDSRFDLALKYYVVAMCLHDNQEPNSRAVSGIFYKAYTVELTFAKKLIGSNSARRTRFTNYSSAV